MLSAHLESLVLPALSQFHRSRLSLPSPSLLSLSLLFEALFAKCHSLFERFLEDLLGEAAGRGDGDGGSTALAEMGETVGRLGAAMDTEAALIRRAMELLETGQVQVQASRPAPPSASPPSLSPCTVSAFCVAAYRAVNGGGITAARAKAEALALAEAKARPAPPGGSLQGGLEAALEAETLKLARVERLARAELALKGLRLQSERKRAREWYFSPGAPLDHELLDVVSCVWMALRNACCHGHTDETCSPSGSLPPSMTVDAEAIDRALPLPAGSGQVLARAAEAVRARKSKRNHTERVPLGLSPTDADILVQALLTTARTLERRGW